MKSIHASLIPVADVSGGRTFPVEDQRLGRLVAGFNCLVLSLLILWASSFPSMVRASELSGLSSQEAAGGLREALGQGAEFAVTTLGRKDGFLANPKVRIALPDKLQQAEKLLRTLGMEKQADELMKTMNRAAESAVMEAGPILADSIRSMTFQDAKAILTGGEDSVTQFFRRSSSERLREKFTPIVRQATEKVGLAKKYNTFAGRAATLGLLDANEADLDSYVTGKAMDGLFFMISEQEKKIRRNPLGAGSELLGKVFGALK